MVPIASTSYDSGARTGMTAKVEGRHWGWKQLHYQQLEKWGWWGWLHWQFLRVPCQWRRWQQIMWQPCWGCEGHLGGWNIDKIGWATSLYPYGQVWLPQMSTQKDGERGWPWWLWDTQWVQNLYSDWEQGLTSIIHPILPIFIVVVESNVMSTHIKTISPSTTMSRAVKELD